MVIFKEEKLNQALQSNSGFNVLSLGWFFPKRTTASQHNTDLLTQMILKDLKIKSTKSEECFDIFSATFKELLVENNPKIIFTTVPSSDPEKEYHGITELAKRIAKDAGLQYINAVNRTSKLAPAKKAHPSAEEHLKTLQIDKKFDINEYIIVLVDDVITQGSSMSACAQLLSEAGARHVCCISLAKTYTKNNVQELASDAQKQLAIILNKSSRFNEIHSDNTKHFSAASLSKRMARAQAALTQSTEEPTAQSVAMQSTTQSDTSPIIGEQPTPESQIKKPRRPS